MLNVIITGIANPAEASILANYDPVHTVCMQKNKTKSRSKSPKKAGN